MSGEFTDLRSLQVPIAECSPSEMMSTSTRCIFASRPNFASKASIDLLLEGSITTNNPPDLVIITDTGLCNESMHHDLRVCQGYTVFHAVSAEGSVSVCALVRNRTISRINQDYDEPEMTRNPDPSEPLDLADLHEIAKRDILIFLRDFLFLLRDSLHQHYPSTSACAQVLPVVLTKLCLLIVMAPSSDDDNSVRLLKERIVHFARIFARDKELLIAAQLGYDTSVIHADAKSQLKMKWVTELKSLLSLKDLIREEDVRLKERLIGISLMSSNPNLCKDVIWLRGGGIQFTADLARKTVIEDPAC